MCHFIAIRVRFKIQWIEHNELSSLIITYSFKNNRDKKRGGNWLNFYPLNFGDFLMYQIVNRIVGSESRYVSNRDSPNRSGPSAYKYVCRGFAIDTCHEVTLRVLSEMDPSKLDVMCTTITLRPCVNSPYPLNNRHIHITPAGFTHSRFGESCRQPTLHWQIGSRMYTYIYGFSLDTVAFNYQWALKSSSDDGSDYYIYILERGVRVSETCCIYNDDVTTYHIQYLTIYPCEFHWSRSLKDCITAILFILLINNVYFSYV